MLKNYFNSYFFKKSKTDFPDFATHYLSLFDSTFDFNQLLESTTFVVLDTETTGLNPKSDNIISVGAVKLLNNTIDIGASLSIHIKNYGVVNRDAISIHGVLPNQNQGVDEWTLAQILLNYLSNNILVGHHIGFDIMMINKMLKKLELPIIKNFSIDTAYLIKRIENPLNAYNLLDQKDYSLDELSQRFDIVTKQRHTAAGDAYITALVFIKLLELFKKRKINSLKELLRK